MAIQSADLSGVASIRSAAPDEAKALSGIALRSKAHWGYSSEFMEACRDELTVPPERLMNDRCDYYVAQSADRIVGFYGLEHLPGETVELEALFVEPDCIGHGVGRRLVEHAIRNAQQCGAACLLIQGDPHAAGFYQAMGARQIGTRESQSIPGRQLPLFALAITEGG